MTEIRAKEPPLEELLDDPIVRLLMRRDGIGPDDVLKTLERVSRRRSVRAPDTCDCILPAGI
jgi:hypothetical protein